MTESHFCHFSPIHSFVMERKKKIRIGVVWSDNAESLGNVVEDEVFQGTPWSPCGEVSMQTMGNTVHCCRMLVAMGMMKQLSASFSKAMRSYSACLNKETHLLCDKHGKEPGACQNSWL